VFSAFVLTVDVYNIKEYRP